MVNSSYLYSILVALSVTIYCVSSATVKPKFKFPERLRIINQYDDVNDVSNSNNNNNNGKPGNYNYNNQQQGTGSMNQNNYGPPLPPPPPLLQQQQQQQQNIQQEIRECVCPCTREYLPICGSDSRTYGNNCLFQCQKKCDTKLQFKVCGTCEEPNDELKLPCF